MDEFRPWRVRHWRIDLGPRRMVALIAIAGLALQSRGELCHWSGAHHRWRVDGAVIAS